MLPQIVRFLDGPGPEFRNYSWSDSGIREFRIPECWIPELVSKCVPELVSKCVKEVSARASSVVAVRIDLAPSGKLEAVFHQLAQGPGYRYVNIDGSSATARAWILK